MKTVPANHFFLYPLRSLLPIKTSNFYLHQPVTHLAVISSAWQPRTTLNYFSPKDRITISVFDFKKCMAYRHLLLTGAFKSGLSFKTRIPKDRLTSSLNCFPTGIQKCEYSELFIFQVMNTDFTPKYIFNIRARHVMDTQVSSIEHVRPSLQNKGNSIPPEKF